MERRWDVSRKGAQKRADRERTAGLDPDDEAARWLREHDPPPPPTTPKRASKSKTLHRWRQRRGERDA